MLVRGPGILASAVARSLLAPLSAKAHDRPGIATRGSPVACLRWAVGGLSPADVCASDREAPNFHRNLLSQSCFRIAPKGNRLMNGPPTELAPGGLEMSRRTQMRMEGVVIDTNVFVAAGFNARSASERILAAIRARRFQLVWNEPTRRETELILRRIPLLGWDKFGDLFWPEAARKGSVAPDNQDLQAMRSFVKPRIRRSISRAALPALTTLDRLRAKC